MSNIILIGMPGCGKSTAGVLLAKAMGYPFVDTDLVIQHKENRLLQDIIDTDGIEAFLKMEERTILEFKTGQGVISTGGSVVYSDRAMQYMKKIGLIIYLQLEYEEIEKRIMNMKSRGIAMEKGQTLMELYTERIPLYEKYQDITVPCSGKDIEETVETLREKIQIYLEN